MEKSYDNDGINIYMVLNEVSWQKDNYEVGMLKNNHICHLADMEIRSVNGNYIPYYNVSGFVEFKSFINTINMGCPTPEIIIKLIKDILSVISGLSSYLLAINSIILEEDFIFYDMKNNDFCFIYVPGYKENIRSQIRKLLENNMKIMRHDNKAETAFVYDIYEKCTEDNFNVKMVNDYIEEHMISRQEPIIENVIQEKLTDEESDSVVSDIKARLSDDNNIYVIYKIVLAVSMGITFFFGAGNICIQYYKMKQIYNTGPVIGVLLLLAAEIFVYFEIVKHKEISEKKDLKSRETQDIQVIRHEEEKKFYGPLYVLTAYGNNANEPIYINQNYLIIGRGNNVDYSLKNVSISRNHAKIYELNNQLVIEDLNSTNGTFINNYPVKAGYPAVIFPGDIIRFGSEEYRMEYV